MKKLKVLGVCGGNGSCLYTFHNRKDFRLVGNIEPRAVFHTKKEEQWDINFKGIPFERGIVPSVRKLRPDVIIGHPDCGDSSVLRMSRAKKKGNLNDNSSVILFFDSINHYLPSIFLLENLPAFLKTYTIERMIDILDDKYELWALQGSVAMFGNSQVSRTRLVVIGVLKKPRLSYQDHQNLAQILDKAQMEGQQGLKRGSLYKRLHPLSGNFQAKSSESFELHRERIEIGNYREPLEKYANLYHPESGRRRITYAEAQLIWQSLPETSQRWPVGGKMKNQPGVSRHILGKPPLTVRKQNRQFGTHNLVLSPREMANIQGFPCSFRLFVDLNERVYWLNKNRITVTKCIPYEISLWFKVLIKQALFR